MNAIEYSSLLSKRVRKLLMICSNYDAFTLKEDGQIETELHQECMELNISDPPRFVWVNSAEAARSVLEEPGNGIDMIICMYNDQDQGILPLARELKAAGSTIPFVMLMHYSKAVRNKLVTEFSDCVDHIFSWHGNADLILAIVKLFEDMANADHDILEVGVQAILLAEDSVRFYSTYLPELYKLVLTQSHEFIKDTLNIDQRQGRKRSRPKILLATSYTDAVELFDKYRTNILGVISDVGMVMHKGDPSSSEKLDAGIDLVRLIREYDPLMPVLLQSSQGSMAEVASSLGAGFMKKYSPTLFTDLSDYMKEEFGFGDFVFRDDAGVEYGRAANLGELQRIISDIPDDVLVRNTSRNMFSKWFYARGLFTMAKRFRSEHHVIASEARAFLLNEIKEYHDETGRGIIAEFDSDNYEDYLLFARCGKGSLGGKARGLGFLNSIIQKYNLATSYDSLRITIPRTMVITTGYFDDFLDENDLQYIVDSDLPDDDILAEFVSSRLPDALLENLKAFLATVDTPLAVRSSSKLEDSNYQPFAGVYSTYMIPFVANRDQMLRLLAKAIKSVYASTFYNGSRNYVKSTGNIQSEEKMAVIVQGICGSDHGGYYYPLVSGVARSVNYYPIGNERKEDGVVSVAFGLGKTVVDGGRCLRFNPRTPRKILQLSDPSLALRDTQKEFYALDLRPGAFKVSRNESVNLARLKVNSALPQYEHQNLVFSTFDSADNRIKPGTGYSGTRIVTFDAILRYGRFPLAKALSDILDICKEELAADVELEFAADLSPDGENLVLTLLQVRPVNEFMRSSETSAEEVSKGLSTVLVESSKALGAGYFKNIGYIAYVSPGRFDNTRTRLMAGEIAAFNEKMKELGEGYLLAAPGRWGSSDPFLGIPVSWNEISESRMIVECGIPGFQVEPSQGTHFFQNITSLGIGYLTVDMVRGNGRVDFDALDSMPAFSEGEFLRVVHTPGLCGFIDRNTNEAIVGI